MFVDLVFKGRFKSSSTVLSAHHTYYCSTTFTVLYAVWQKKINQLIVEITQKCVLIIAKENTKGIEMHVTDEKLRSYGLRQQKWMTYATKNTFSH